MTLESCGVFLFFFCFSLFFQGGWVADIITAHLCAHVSDWCDLKPPPRPQARSASTPTSPHAWLLCRAPVLDSLVRVSNLFLAALGLCCQRKSFPNSSKWRLLFIAGHGLTAMASLVGERGSRAQPQQLQNMRLVAPLHVEASKTRGPRGLRVSPALTAGFLTTGPPGRPQPWEVFISKLHFLYYLEVIFLTASNL